MNDKIPESFWSVVKARFKLMPDNLRIVIGGYGSLTKKDILKHLEKRDEIGRLLVKMQMEYLKVLKEGYKKFDDKIR